MLDRCALRAAVVLAHAWLAACQPYGNGRAQVMATGGDASRGAAAIAQYGCGSCHIIPGVEGATGMVGPPLTGFGRRVMIAGETSNTPDQLIQWIEVPQSIEPKTAMPALGVTARDARDIAAYLYTLR